MDNETDWKWWGGFFVVVALILLGIALYINSAWVTDERALARIQTKYPAGTTIEILTDSGNDMPGLQSIDDVTFELRIQRPDREMPELVSARCTDGIFQDMVCRVYSADGTP